MTPLDPDLLLRAYSIGIFPMADSRDAADVFWVEPRRRAIIPLDGFRLSKSLRKVVRSDRFRVTTNKAFAQVVQACADREETWINDAIENSYGVLHARSAAHSVECWMDGELVGGLYGVRLGGAFFGESMFSTRTDASKVALAWLVARLRAGGFRLLDCQFMTYHLRSLGAVEIAQRDYLALLDSAVSATVPEAGSAAADSAAGATAFGAPDFGALDRLLAAGASAGTPPGWVIAQLLGQTS